MANENSTKTTPNSHADNKRYTIIVVGFVLVVILGLCSYAAIHGTGLNGNVSTQSKSAQSAQSGGIPDAKPVNKDVKFVAPPKVKQVAVIDSHGTKLVDADKAPGEKTLSVIYDYACPYCAQFDEYFTDMIDDQTKAGNMTYVTHPVAILSGYAFDDPKFADSVSAKSAVIGYYVAQNMPNKLLDFNFGMARALGYVQSKGYSDQLIKNILVGVGVTDEVADAAVNASHDSAWIKYISGVTENFVNSANGRAGTPDIKVNRELIPNLNWTKSPESLVEYLSSRGLVVIPTKQS